MHFKSKLMGVG